MEFLLQASLHESAVPSFGNSKSTGVKQLNSAPRMTPEGQKFLSLGIASPSPAPRDLVKCQANSTVVAISPVHVPGHGKSPSMKIEGHDSLVLSVKPSLAPSKAPKLHEPVIADTSIKGCDSLALSITPNGHDMPTSETCNSTLPSPAGGDSVCHHRNPATVEAVGQLAIWEPDARNLLERRGIQDQRRAISTKRHLQWISPPLFVRQQIYLCCNRDIYVYVNK